MPGEPLAEMTGSWPASLPSIGVARRQVRGWLRDQGLEGIEDECLVVVSELATNAVVHAKSGFVVTVTRLSDGLLVRVDDASSDRPVLPEGLPALSSLSGRGTYLVDVLSESWGVFDVGDGGKATWAVLAH